MRFCTQCGASLDADEQFCWQCGFRQPDQVSPPAQYPLPVQPQPAFPPYGTPATVPVPAASGIVLSPQMIAGIIVVFIIIAAVLYFVLPQRLPSAGSPAGGGSTGTGAGPSGTDPLQGPKAPSTASTQVETSRTQITITTSGCPQGLVLCNGFCRDATTDEQNCGGCGATCAANQVCSSGRCTTVQGSSGSASVAFTLPATSLAVTTTTSAMVAAPPPTTSGCPAGNTLCYGTCVDLLTNNGNCGSCNKRCIEGQKCEGGRCVVSYCLKPLSMCSGVCKNLFTDTNNCGSCGKACPSPVSHGTASCQSGVCKVTCDQDYGNCDGIIANGCEAYFKRNNNNCGSCGNKCQYPTSCWGSCLIPK